MILNISLQISGNIILKTLINCLEMGIVTI